jgi:hypothetical protein
VPEVSGLPVVIVGAVPDGEEMVMDSVPEVLSGDTPLLAVTVKVQVCAVVGVPEIVPLDASVNPPHTLPVASVQVIGVSPLAVSIAEYGMPTTPAVSAPLLVMVGAVCVTVPRVVSFQLGSSISRF